MFKNLNSEEYKESVINSIKILSWNINMFNPSGQDLITRCEYLINTIKLLDYDILCIQEASSYFLDILLNQLIFYKLCDKTKTHCGLCVILFKENLNIIIKEIKKFENIGVNISINFKNSEYNEIINIVSCHLVPYYEKQLYRLKQIDTIINYLNDKSNIIIIGDLNMNNDQYYIKDSFYDLAINSKNLNNTWFESWFVNGSTKSKRFDRIYTNMNFIKNYKVHTEYKKYSDHAPISCEILI